MPERAGCSLQELRRGESFGSRARRILCDGFRVSCCNACVGSIGWGAQLYGPTGSGKTYTITGAPAACAINCLFRSSDIILKPGRPESIVKHGSGDVSDGLVTLNLPTDNRRQSYAFAMRCLALTQLVL
eukprot:1428586-Rhodomonas_salina.3